MPQATIRDFLELLSRRIGLQQELEGRDARSTPKPKVGTPASRLAFLAGLETDNTVITFRETY